MKTTLEIDAELYREVKIAAAEEGRPVTDVVDEALQGWLERRDWAHGVAETKASYGGPTGASKRTRTRGGRRPRMSTSEQIAARWRHLRPVDADALRQDLDALLDTSL